MKVASAFHALRELSLAGATTPADQLAAYDALGILGKAAGLPEEARLAEVIAAGLRGEETMELRFRELNLPPGSSDGSNGKDGA